MSYNHESKSLVEACGYSEDEVKTFVGKANEVARKVHLGAEDKFAASKIVEGYENSLEKRELAFLLYKVQQDLAEMRSMGGMFGGNPESSEALEAKLAEILGNKGEE